MSAEEVGNAFVNHFYTTKDTNPDALGGLFTAQSMLTMEGNQVQGGQAIVEKIKSIGQNKHTVKTIDIQPSHSPNAVVIFVTGIVQIGGGNPVHFCEFFHLISNAPGQFQIHNDVFRLNYGL